MKTVLIVVGLAAYHGHSTGDWWLLGAVLGLGLLSMLIDGALNVARGERG